MSSFEPAPGFVEAVAEGPEMKALLAARARVTADAARALAPYPRIASQISVEGNRVVSNDYITNFWEYGTVKNPAVPFLRPAGEETTSDFTPG